MPAKQPRPDELEPIERASRDELRALQLQRLRWSLAHAYDNVPHYRARLRREGRASARPAHARGSRQVSVHGQDRSARQLSVRHVRGAARAGRAHPRVVGHDRQADGRRLHAQRHRHVGDRDGAVDPRGRRARRRHPARRVRLRALHRRPRRALRRREAGLHGDPDVGRPDREAGPADRRLQADGDHGDAVVHAGDRRGDGAAGHRSRRRARSRSASSAPSRGRRRCARRSRRSSRWTRSTSTDCRR